MADYQSITPYLDRFFARLSPPDRNGCRVWLGACSSNGYGMTTVADRPMSTHRFAFLAANGYLPALVMHTCDNKQCCASEHLRPGTYKENADDCLAKGRHSKARMSACKHGHPYTAENTGRRGRRRECLTCRRTWGRRYRASKRLTREPKLKRTHCSLGHALTGDNLLKNGGCRTCKNAANAAYMRQYYARRRQAQSTEAA